MNGKEKPNNPIKPKSMRKEEILPFATSWMNAEDIMLSAISQAEKGKYWPYGITGMWHLE